MEKAKTGFEYTEQEPSSGRGWGLGRRGDINLN